MKIKLLGSPLSTNMYNIHQRVSTIVEVDTLEDLIEKLKLMNGFYVTKNDKNGTLLGFKVEYFEEILESDLPYEQ